MGGEQEVDPAHVLHGLGGDQQGDLVRPGGQPLEFGQGRPGRALGQDVVVEPEAAAEVVLERAEGAL
jgi:hypothetical protein